MEDTLRVLVARVVLSQIAVLILVLMEDTLRDGKETDIIVADSKS